MGAMKFVPLPIAAAQLGLSWAQAYRELLTHKLKGERRGARWFVNLDSLAEYIRTQKERRTGSQR